MKTVLIMDDDTSNRFVLRNVLSVQFEVVEASTLAEAVAVCEGRGCVDLMVADVVMPVATGPEIAKRLLAICPSMCVLFVSGYPFETLTSREVLVAEDFRNAVAVGFLQKPFTARVLLAKAEEILSEAGRRGDGRESSANTSAQ